MPGTPPQSFALSPHYQPIQTLRHFQFDAMLLGRAALDCNRCDQAGVVRKGNRPAVDLERLIKLASYLGDY